MIDAAVRTHSKGSSMSTAKLALAALALAASAGAGYFTTREQHRAEAAPATSADIAALRADFANSYGTLEPRLRKVEEGFAGVHEFIEEQKRRDLERALQGRR